MGTLSADINTILGNVTTLNTSLTPIIGRESQVKAITDRELGRLRSKKVEVDDAYNTNKRFVDLNDSYRKKQSQYNFLMFVVISFFVVMIILMQIQKAIPAIAGLLTLVTVILAIVVIVYVLFILVDINRRNPMDFDKINYNPPPGIDNVVIDPVTGRATTVSSGLINPETGKKFDPASDLSRRNNVRINSGQDACFVGHTYDFYSGRCIPGCQTESRVRDMTNTLYNTNNVLDYGKFTVANFAGDSGCVVPGSCSGNNKVCGKFCIPRNFACGAESAEETFTGTINLGDNVSANTPNEFSTYSLV